jgi:hypothetical protein
MMTTMAGVSTLGILLIADFLKAKFNLGQDSTLV